MGRTILLMALSQGAWAAPPGFVIENKTVDLMAPAPGDEAAHKRAEYNRLSDRLHALSEKNNLVGARRIYGQLEELAYPLSYADLLVGAQVYRSGGDVDASYTCLRKAARIQGTREVIDWLVAIDAQYGRVSLRVEKGMLGDLRAERPPILPDQKAAIELARGRVAETGTFSGFLPGGEYTLAGQRFEVRPGAHALELSLTQTE